MIQRHTIHEHDVFAHISCVCMRLGNIAHTHTQYIGHTQANDTKTHHTCTQCICLYIVCLYAIGNIARIDTQYIGSLHVATTCRENRVLLHTHRDTLPTCTTAHTDTRYTVSTCTRKPTLYAHVWHDLCVSCVSHTETQYIDKRHIGSLHVPTRCHATCLYAIRPPRYRVAAKTHRML